MAAGCVRARPPTDCWVGARNTRLWIEAVIASRTPTLYLVTALALIGGYPLLPGTFGENLTIAGFESLENEVRSAADWRAWTRT